MPQPLYSWETNTRYTPIVQPTRCTYYLKLFILVKRSTCFGRSFRPSSGAQKCVYSNDICQTAADDGRKDRPKHLERFTRINNSR